MGDETLKLTLQMLQESMKRNEELTNTVLKQNEELRSEIKELRAQVSSTENTQTQAKPTRHKLESEMLRKFNRKRKDIVKSKIMELIRFKQMPIPELKEIIVDEQEYCSKATFYRYISDMQAKGIIQNVDNFAVVIER